MNNTSVELAFKKLLSFVYYDKSGTMLQLRSRMAKRIAAGEREEILENVSRIINGSDNIDGYLERIDSKLVPKGVKTNHENGNVLTNYRKEERNEADGINLMFDGPVEIFVLSVYWLIKHGYKLDSLLGDHCYGNRLWTEGEDKEIKSGRALLRPYINQYQTWRDKAISTAKSHLEDGTEVGFVNLDITKFYYNVRLNWKDIQDELDVDKRDPVHKAIYNVYKKYSQYVEEVYGSIFKIGKGTFSSDNSITLLPIGLPSSYVLANYHLLEFDDLVKQKVKPLYYGRYVDDILLVIKEPNVEPEPVKVKVKFLSGKTEIRNVTKAFNLSKSVQFVGNNLNDLFEVEYTIKIRPIDDDIDTSLENYKFNFKSKALSQLFIQNEKVMIYEFKPNYSLSAIEKLKHDLEERSSEFRFLPTTEDTDFDKSAFHLLFDDSFGKPRTLKDYKENRFGIASYLFKRTAVALWTSKSEVSDEAKKILAFFKGSNIIRFYQQWERLFTYFVAANRKNELNDLLDEILKEIGNVFFDDNEKISTGLQKHLLEALCTSLSQAFALNPEFIKNDWAKKRLSNSISRYFSDAESQKCLYEIELLTLSIRKSHLLRHFYLQHPLIEYSPFSNSEDVNSVLPLIGKPFDYDSIKVEEYKITGDNLNPINFPRYIKFYEVCLYLWRLRILECKENFEVQGSSVTDVFEASTFLDAAWEIYSGINFGPKGPGKNVNGRDLKETFFNTHCKRVNVFEDNIEEERDAHIHEIHVNYGNDFSEKDEISLALANIKVDWDKEAVQALKNRPNNISIDRQQKFAKLVNLLTEEQKFSPDLFILPEISVPHELVTYLSYYSVKHQVAMLLGTEHVRAGGLGINFIHSILPIEVNDEMFDAIFLPRLKNHYSHEEIKEIDGHQLTPLMPENFHYHLIKFRSSYYTTFYCFELSDIEHRGWFRSKIDFLAAPEFNHDVNYFSNIVESSARDLNTFVVQVNTSDYGDTRLTQPTKTEQKDLVRIKGGENDVIIIGTIKIDKFRKFQELGYNLQKDLKIFKPSPPNFNVSYVHKRINGDWIFDDECENTSED